MTDEYKAQKAERKQQKKEEKARKKEQKKQEKEQKKLEKQQGDAQDGEKKGFFKKLFSKKKTETT